ncbi:uncharacterized protein LOC126903571 [Daktulosphaira vitifoliae]|uniref:uncharacterized protein LOC126903571 n=1 Tax=Daktulosphaira vitifoliae TaxID=58002 RepID=UPI0021AAC5DA|nr:uncharacterized protein LOC126903571 [Daktulosphaira vitifoliae]
MAKSEMDNEVLKELRALRTQLNVLNEMVRKNSNSVNVVVRFLAGFLDISRSKLVDILTEAQANITTVQPNDNINMSQPLIIENGYPSTQIKLMMELLKMCSSYNPRETSICPIDPLNIPLTSLQTQASHISPIPVTQHKIDLEQHSTVPNQTMFKDSASSVNDNRSEEKPKSIHNVSVNNRRKEEEELRRKYRNKYRYMNIGDLSERKRKAQEQTHIHCKNPITDLNNINILNNYQSDINKDEKESLEFDEPFIKIDRYDCTTSPATSKAKINFTSAKRKSINVSKVNKLKDKNLNLQRSKK